MVHIIGEKKSASNIILLGQDIEDESLDEDPEYSDEFEPAIWLIHHNYDITMDPTIDQGKTRDEQLAQAEIGILEADFGGWKIYVNWQLKWAQKIPPHHMGVERRGVLVGIVSPYLTMRTCWNCGRGDALHDGEWNDDRMWVKVNRKVLEERISAGAITLEEANTMPARIPAVLPAHPCPKPDCKQYDWFGDMGDGLIARREDFQRDAAEALAERTGKENVAIDMRMHHDPTGEGKMSYAHTGV